MNKCYCGAEVEYALIPISIDPDCTHVCFSCLSPEEKTQYLKFYGKLTKEEIKNAKSNE